jgi:hypothetical protein
VAIIGLNGKFSTSWSRANTFGIVVLINSFPVVSLSDGGYSMSMKIDRAAEARDIERGNRQISLSRPFFTHEVVERIIKRDFHYHSESEVLGTLNEYKSDDDEGTSRVQLAALKLSEGSLHKLKQFIEEAKRDFRDVVGPAETPRLLAVDPVVYLGLPEDEKDRITDEDLDEYLSWVQKT